MVGGQLEREGVVKEKKKKKFNRIPGDRGEMSKVQGKENMIARGEGEE